MLNQVKPYVMHIDLNSCFATVEQQARPRLRGRPVAIVNRRTEHTMIVTASYEAKAMGVKLGMRLKDAQKLCPDLIGLESDPPKYRYVYHQLMRIMSDYSAHVRMKSIDEGVIDFSEAPMNIRERDLKDVGWEIKNRIWKEIGCAMNCNVGIATNRFLAKTAASLHKPNGLDVITHENLRGVFASLELTDLTGIAGRYEKRLNAAGIYTPLDFLDIDEETLRKVVFKSVNGTYWYKRLRGWEVDKRDFSIKTAGRQYVLEEYKMSREKVLQRLHHLSEEVGQKIRSKGLVARGVQVHARGYHHEGTGWGGSYWHARKMMPVPFFSNNAIYALASDLFSSAPEYVKEIGVTCYGLSDSRDMQLALFGDNVAESLAVTTTIDMINERYGGRTIHSADTLETNEKIRAKVPFGSTRYL